MLHSSPLVENGRTCFPTLRPRGQPRNTWRLCNKGRFTFYSFLLYIYIASGLADLHVYQWSEETRTGDRHNGKVQTKKCRSSFPSPEFLIVEKQEHQALPGFKVLKRYVWRPHCFQYGSSLRCKRMQAKGSPRLVAVQRSTPHQQRLWYPPSICVGFTDSEPTQSHC